MQGTLLKLLVKDKLLHSGKVPVNTELRPLRRKKTRNGSSAILHFERGDFYTGLPHIYFSIHSLIPVLSFAQERLDSAILKQHHVTRELLI